MSNYSASGGAYATTNFDDLPTIKFGESVEAQSAHEVLDAEVEAIRRETALVNNHAPLKLVGGSSMVNPVEQALLKAVAHIDDDKVLAPATETAQCHSSGLAPESWNILREISREFVMLSCNRGFCAYERATGIEHCLEGFCQLVLSKYGYLRPSDSDAKEQQISAGKTWWNSALWHKRIVTSVVMEPTRKSPADDAADNPHVLNRWHLLAKGRVMPNMNATLADIQIFTDHLHYLAAGEQAAVQHFMCWLAQLYQYPEYKLGTAQFMFSEKNHVGKSFMIHLFKRVFGGSPLVAECEGAALGDKFTSLLDDGILRLYNELPSGFDRSRVEVLKTLISEKTRKSERKGRDAKDINSYVNLIITTNKADALPLMDNDPRFNVFRCLADRLPDEYYERLMAWFEGEGPALLAGVLAQWQFPADWNIKRGGALAPQTAAAIAMQRESRDDLVTFIEGLVAGREAPFDKDVGRALALIKQLTTTYPEVIGGLKLNFKTLSSALQKLGAVRIGSGSASKDNAWAWRHQRQWATASLKDWQAYLDGSAPRPFPATEGTDHE